MQQISSESVVYIEKLYHKQDKTTNRWLPLTRT